MSADWLQSEAVARSCAVNIAFYKLYIKFYKIPKKTFSYKTPSDNCLSSEKRFEKGYVITYDLFFNSSEAITDYLLKRNPQLYCINISAEQVTGERRDEHTSFVITSCTNQHFIVFKSQKSALFKE